MTRNSSYEIDFINSKIIVTRNFIKAAGKLNSEEYNTMRQLRQAHPDFTIKLRDIRKKEGKNSGRNLTYEHMKEYIIAKEGKETKTLEEFEKVKATSKSKAGPYAFVKTWFINRYPEDFKTKKEEKTA